MKYIIDSYTLEYIEGKGQYYISFDDSNQKNCRIEINKDIFDTYTESKRAYTKIKNEGSRHLEQSELTDINLYSRATNKGQNLEEEAIKEIYTEKLNRAKDSLTDIQMKRIKAHIEDEVSIRDLAKQENVRTKQIEKSIALGLNKLKKFF